MRSRHPSALVIGFVLMAALALAAPVAAQEYEEYELPPLAEPVEGFTRSDGTTVLRDTDFCRYLLSSVLGPDELTPSRLIDRTKKQRKARRAAFQPATDEAVLQRCTDVLNAFRTELAADDPLAEWARTGPVVPEAFGNLLPADLAADPLAEPEPVGDGSRTAGHGDLQSAPFGLTGGTFFAQVDAPGCDAWSGTIRGVRDPSLELGPVADQMYLYDVVPASYYWDITAPDCDWSVDLVAVELGPEPTPTPLPTAVVPKLIADGPLHIEAERAEFLTAAAARQAVLEAGLTTGTCGPGSAQYIGPGYVVSQDPPFGSVVEPGTPVNVTATSDCDIYLGERVVLE